MNQSQEKARLQAGATMLAKWPYNPDVMIAIEEATTRGCGYWWRGDRLALVAFENANEPLEKLELD